MPCSMDIHKDVTWHAEESIPKKKCMLHAPVPLVKLLPGRTGAEIGHMRAQYACARHGMLHECRQQHPMSCKKECMHKHACCVHLCRRAGCCQAGLGAGTVSLALNMSVRGMACCMRIKNCMKNAACMPDSRHSDYRRSPPPLSENRRNRRFSESEAGSPGACHDVFK